MFWIIIQNDRKKLRLLLLLEFLLICVHVITLSLSTNNVLNLGLQKLHRASYRVFLPFYYFIKLVITSPSIRWGDNNFSVCRVDEQPLVVETWSCGPVRGCIVMDPVLWTTSTYVRRYGSSAQDETRDDTCRTERSVCGLAKVTS